MLRASSISKRFGPTIALDAVDLLVRDGEIHALIGENGAGKSTLVNILAGRLRPDSGHIVLDNMTLRKGSREPMHRDRVAAVFQSPMLFERMSWAENLALGGFAGKAMRLDLDHVAERARKLADELGFELPADGIRIADCSINQRVRLEILRALSLEPRVLILDEPTSVLAPTERDTFLDLLRRLRNAGRAIILVTHKLAEALAVANYVTVLRGGRKVADREAERTDQAELARLMIGEAAVQRDYSNTEMAAGKPALSLEGIMYEDRSRRVLDVLSLRVHTHEIVGIAGVDGNGQTELAAMLAGLIQPSAGKLWSEAPESLAVIPQNRDLDGLILPMALWENLMLSQPLRDKFVHRGWLSRQSAMEFCRRILEQFAIHARQPELNADALSGGNRQRLMMARAFAASPRVVVAHDLCRGMDQQATSIAHQRLRDYAASGGAVLLISSDLDEIFALCHRIHVMNGGRLTEVPANDRDPARIGLLMSGTPA